LIVDVEASSAVRPAEVTTAKRMIERIEQRFDLYPERLAVDAAYGSTEMLGWLVHERGSNPTVRLSFYRAASASSAPGRAPAARRSSSASV
jgi:hypothetical protein